MSIHFALVKFALQGFVFVAIVGGGTIFKVLPLDSSTDVVFRVLHIYCLYLCYMVSTAVFITDDVFDVSFVIVVILVLSSVKVFLLLANDGWSLVSHVGTKSCPLQICTVCLLKQSEIITNLFWLNPFILIPDHLA